MNQSYFVKKRSVQRLPHFFKIIRWPNLVIIFLTQSMGRIFLVGPRHQGFTLLAEPPFLLISLTTISIAAAGYIINDYFDVKIDLINKPEQVIIGRTISRRWGIIFHQALNLIGVISGFMVSWPVGLTAMLCAVLLWLYAAQFKRLAFVGNVLVSILTGLSLVMLSLYYQQNGRLLAIYAIFAFSITLIREIIKDLEDVRGDARYGCRTLPIVWGIRRTKRFLYYIILLFSGIVIVLGWQLQNLRVYSILLLLGIPLGWLVYKLLSADRKAHFAFLSSFCKMIMVLGIASMAAL